MMFDAIFHALVLLLVVDRLVQLWPRRRCNFAGGGGGGGGGNFIVEVDPVSGRQVIRPVPRKPKNYSVTIGAGGTSTIQDLGGADE